MLEEIMRSINLDLIRVTEAAAIAAAHWVGSGRKEDADKAATLAIKNRLDQMEFAGVVAIGEGEKDRSYGLFEGEQVGRTKASTGQLIHPMYDLAIDPIEGTTPTVTSGPEAISTLAVAGKDCMYRTKAYYMNKLAYGPHIKANCDLHLDYPLDEIVEMVAKATNKSISEIMVCILNRPRHDKFIAELRAKGVRIKLIQDCDVSGAVAACMPDSGIDFLYGIGGAPEAVISAAAIKCMGGGFHGKEVEIDSNDKSKWSYKGEELKINDLVKKECAFAATGITDGSMLRGVRFAERGPITQSVFMRSESGTVRWVTTNHGN